jgi:hypothetical protein
MWDVKAAADYSTGQGHKQAVVSQNVPKVQTIGKVTMEK